MRGKRRGQGFNSPRLQASPRRAKFRRSVANGEAGRYNLHDERRELRLVKPPRIMPFTYVYILQSKSDPKRFYTGITDDLRERIKRHNEGRISHASKWKPWTLKSYIALSGQQRAAALEKYLKSHSGRAFAKKHL